MVVVLVFVDTAAGTVTLDDQSSQVNKTAILWRNLIIKLLNYFVSYKSW